MLNIVLFFHIRPVVPHVAEGWANITLTPRVCQVRRVCPLRLPDSGRRGLHVAGQLHHVRPVRLSDPLRHLSGALPGRTAHHRVLAVPQVGRTDGRTEDGRGDAVVRITVHTVAIPRHESAGSYNMLGVVYYYPWTAFYVLFQ